MLYRYTIINILVTDRSHDKMKLNDQEYTICKWKIAVYTKTNIYIQQLLRYHNTRVHFKCV